MMEDLLTMSVPLMQQPRQWATCVVTTKFPKWIGGILRLRLGTSYVRIIVGIINRWNINLIYKIYVSITGIL